MNNTFDFSKPGESIHFIGGYVIKHFDDPQQIALRVKRAATSLAGFVPPIVFSAETLFGYKTVDGNTIYEAIEVEGTLADAFFAWCVEHFWNPMDIHLDDEKQEAFAKACTAFYQDKTLERIQRYWETAGHDDQPGMVNGVQTPALEDILRRIDWGWLCEGMPSRFHGDLQFDNVLAVAKDNGHPFVLLDWRGDFAGLTDYGDMYYDLAKLYGGMKVAYREVKKGNFALEEDEKKISISLPKEEVLAPIRTRYERFLEENGFDQRKVRLLTGLIFINMSPLHHEPFSRLLYHLGKAELVKALSYARA